MKILPGKPSQSPNIVQDEHILIIKDYGQEFPWRKEIRAAMRNSKQQDRFITFADILEFDEPFFLHITKLSPEVRDLIPSLHHGRGLFISTIDDANDDDSAESLTSFVRLLDPLGIPIYQLHASGHADSHDIIDLIETVHPAVVIPIHTANPQFFERLFEASDIGVQNLEQYNIYDIN